MMAETSKGLDGRRLCLQKNDFSTFLPTAHAGLWIDKYLPEQAKGLGEIKAKHFEQAARHSVDDVYKDFFKRWQKSLEGAGAQTHKATVNGRLAIGLGGESVLETAISLHRTYGVPYIPGSALKGLAAHYAHNRLNKAEWGEQTDAYKILFGNTKTAGYVTFYDALYVPNSANYGTFKNTPLAVDVINVHHPDYYGGKDVPPADWDSPTPVSFLSATGSYLIALGGPAEWVKAAFEILACALREEGIGAKTSSGYGRMTVEDVACKEARMGAQVTPASELEPVTPIETHKGVIVEINPSKYYGKVRDLADEREYRFDIKTVLGNTPARKAIVMFEVQNSKVIKVKKL